MKMTKAKLLTPNYSWLLCEFKNGERRLVRNVIGKKMNTEKSNTCKERRTGIWNGQACVDDHLYKQSIPVIHLQNLHRVVRENRKTKSIIFVPFTQTGDLGKYRRLNGHRG